MDFWSTIWDTGGTDTIAHYGSAGAMIDLTAATLDYSPTGGGVRTYIDRKLAVMAALFAVVVLLLAYGPAR